MQSNNSYRLSRAILLPAFLIFLTLLTGTLSGYANEGATMSNTAHLKVVTSISPLADLVRNVGGSRLTVAHFVPLNVDPHTYEPTFSSLQAVSQAQIIFLNGDGLDRVAKENLAALRNINCQVVDLSHYVPASMKNGVDPHYWLDLKLVEYYVRGIADNLSAISKADGPYFHANAESYLDRIRKLDAHIREASSKLPSRCRSLVLYHNAWTYAATRYGFNVIGIIETSGTHEPSARQLAMLIRKAREQGTQAIVAEPGRGSRILTTVKEEASIPVVLEMTEDSLREPPNDTYLGMIETDLTKLCRDVCALKN